MPPDFYAYIAMAVVGFTILNIIEMMITARKLTFMEVFITLGFWTIVSFILMGTMNPKNADPVAVGKEYNIMSNYPGRITAVTQGFDKNTRGNYTIMYIHHDGDLCSVSNNNGILTITVTSGSYTLKKSLPTTVPFMWVEVMQDTPVVCARNE